MAPSRIRNTTEPETASAASPTAAPRGEAAPAERPLIESYRLEIRRSHCHPGFEGVHGIVHLAVDIGEAIPYLHGALGGDAFTAAPPSVLFKAHGRLVGVHGRQIAINALRDAEEAERVARWIVAEINEAWQRRGDPAAPALPRRPPGVLEVLRRLPRTNCGECRAPTCLAFAVGVAQGGRRLEDCPHLRERSSPSEA